VGADITGALLPDVLEGGLLVNHWP
jgi:hypothetical protein